MGLFMGTGVVMANGNNPVGNGILHACKKFPIKLKLVTMDENDELMFVDQ